MRSRGWEWEGKILPFYTNYSQWSFIVLLVARESLDRAQELCSRVAKRKGIESMKRRMAGQLLRPEVVHILFFFFSTSPHDISQLKLYESTVVYMYTYIPGSVHVPSFFLFFSPDFFSRALINRFPVLYHQTFYVTRCQDGLRETVRNYSESRMIYWKRSRRLSTFIYRIFFFFLLHFQFFISTEHDFSCTVGV